MFQNLFQQFLLINVLCFCSCGKVQTGSFLTGGAPNGLFGLGMSNISVPSTLAHNGYTSGSFSMCFSPNGIGRISFGDKGSTGQGETSFNQGQPRRYSLLESWCADFFFFICLPCLLCLFFENLLPVRFTTSASLKQVLVDKLVILFIVQFSIPVPRLHTWMIQLIHL